MRWTREIWTYLIVTIVAALIWVWAAAETRERKSIDYARVQFTVPDQADWMIQPDQARVTIMVEGSKLAIQRFETLMRRPLKLGIAPTAGSATVDMADRLRAQDDVHNTGVTIVNVEPPLAEVTLDNIVRESARVKANLPGIIADGDITIDPADVTVSMPGQLRQRFPQELTVEAFIDRSELDRLEPGVRHTREVRLRLPENSGVTSGVSISPVKATISFTIRSRTREARLESVRVQLAGPPEDRDMLAIEIDPKQLRNVTISADSDLIRRIESGEVPVVAVLHISSREKEARIESKRVSYFIALVPDANGSTRYVPVTFKGDANDMPLIKLKITPRAG